MAVRRESDCVGCGLPCTGSCSYYNSYSTYLVCDKCGCDTDILYQIGNQELCRECAIEECRDDIVEQCADMYLEECDSITEDDV